MELQRREGRMEGIRKEYYHSGGRSVHVILFGLDGQGNEIKASSYKLVHRVRHSPDGFAWGYGGSGPSDLARSILWDFLDHEPKPDMYHEFKFDVVSSLEDNWVLGSAEISRWLREYEEGDQNV